MKNKLQQLLIMSSKFTLYGMVLQLFFVVSLWATELAAQETKSVKEVNLSMQVESKTILDIFRIIEQKTAFKFFYENKYIDRNLRYDFNSRSISVNDILLQISRESNLKFKQINNTINVTTKEPGQNGRTSEIEIIIQTRTITGKVTSMEDSEGLPGVNVVEKGTSNGTVTDIQGNYSLEVSEGATLVFSSVGYTQEEIQIGNRSVIDVSMSADMQQLEDIVVVGYGTQQRKDLTGAISSVKPEDLQRIQAASLDEALSGLAAGVQVTSASGEPGAPVSIRIRGGGSLTAGSDPLYVVDGFAINNSTDVANVGGVGSTVGSSNNPLSFLNPNDIESLEILKDASATAIYGARGANGVVLITTKRGQRGASNIDFSATYGVQVLPSGIPTPLNSNELADLWVESWINTNNGDRTARAIPDIETYNTLTGLGSNNWVKEITRNSSTANYQLTFSGGNEKTRYVFAANYFNQQGIVKGSNFDRYTMRLNLDSKLKDYLTVGANIVGARTAKDGVITGSTNSSVGGPVQAAFAYAPWGSVRVTAEEAPIYEEFGTTVDVGDYNPGVLIGGGIENPVALTEAITIKDGFDRFLANTFINWDILPGLSFRPSIGIDLSYTNRQSYFPSTTNRGDPRGTADWAQRNGYTLLNENLLIYKKVIGRHDFGATGLFSWQKDYDENIRIGSTNFVNDLEGPYGIEDGEIISRPSTSAGENSLVSYMLRFNYIFDQKYLITLTGRADGSSKFGQNNKFGFFPSASLAWRLSEEDFVKNTGFFDDLKLRVSYGITGNQEIPRYNTLTRYQTTQTIIGGNVTNGVFQQSISNQDLRWERSKMLNIGIDASIFNGRLNIVAEVYDQRTDDLLYQVTIPSHTGFRSVTRNIGEIQNRGVELSLNGQVVQHSNFNWTTSFNISRNEQKVLALSPGLNTVRIDRPLLSNEIREAYTVLQVGKPLGNFYGVIIDGIWQSREEIEASGTQPDANPGDYKIKDLDGDGRVTGADRGIIGNGQPDFYFGLTNRLRYKAFDLSFLINGSFGQEIANLNAEFAQNYQPGRAAMQQALDRWTPSNTDAKFRAAGSPQYKEILKSTSIEDGSFVRLKNVQLAYNFPATNLEWLRNASVFVAIDNLYTITNYTGFDPEVNSFGSNNFLYSVDVEAYPRASTYRIGINIGL